MINVDGILCMRFPFSTCNPQKQHATHFVGPTIRVNEVREDAYIVLALLKLHRIADYLKCSNTY